MLLEHGRGFHSLHLCNLTGAWLPHSQGNTKQQEHWMTVLFGISTLWEKFFKKNMYACDATKDSQAFDRW
eukprot:c41685_g1_i1 orf=3-209(-)